MKEERGVGSRWIEGKDNAIQWEGMKEMHLSIRKNEGKMSGDNDSLVLETHQRNEGKWGGGGGVATSRMKER